MSSSQTMTAPAVGHRPPDAGPNMSSIYDYGRSQQPDDHRSPSPPSDSAIRALNDSAPDPPRCSFQWPGFSLRHDALVDRRACGNTAMSSDPTGGQDQIPANSNELPESQQEQKNSDQPPEVPFSNPEEDLSISLKHADPSEGLTDPLLFSKSGLDHSDLFTPFDITGAAKDPFEALQQNEMLTAAYLSQSADLSALGYSGGHLQDTGSIAGSEPRIQAFAKLEFDDGHFYCNTYSFILGRDVRAARAAHQRELQVRQAMRHSRAKSSSGGNTSHTPIRMKPEGSGMIGSVVSDRGGIMGFDPDVPPIFLPV
ncbi:forkhead domain protein [Aspergillus nomiae NRRL 13137]|uniref:Forkhead domain protein n=1 Tax=Aspergillus nomiae NRRL (strain ATCC 15546 / NRRL 13137 / CBS 260.88 / M93) TaxID=1509407 RepID=A0A0L1IM92_ASPN3|nr:forkhead domain protein [Aspergillus nomiae NRRL 13137]KNG80694.1 forkhead domain protein [Aspergillus nomiae NRRL 13137]